MDRGNYDQALPVFRDLAGQGWPHAQYALGKAYLKGHGVQQDRERAAEYFKKAIAVNSKRRGHASFYLGRMYKNGEAVPQDYARAKDLFERALKGNQYTGAFDKAGWPLGEMYEQGLGVQQDYDKAIELYKQAATHAGGDADAYMRLARMYREGRGVPVIQGYEPMPHTSRKGWLARKDCYERDPFTGDVDAPLWSVRPAYWEAVGAPPRTLSLREIAARVAGRFRAPVRRIADPFSLKLIEDVLQGRAPSLLDLPDRPEAYDHVGRLCVWDNLFPERLLRRSRYERILIRAIRGAKLRIKGQSYTPLTLDGWSAVVFRRDRDGTRHTYPFDVLLEHLEDW